MIATGVSNCNRSYLTAAGLSDCSRPYVVATDTWKVLQHIVTPIRSICYQSKSLHARSRYKASAAFIGYHRKQLGSMCVT